MSERELQRVEVLSQVADGTMSVTMAAAVMDRSARQVQRLLRRFRTEGAAAIRHKARGRRSNNRVHDGVRDYALTLIRESHADFGPTLAAEKLAERHGLVVSRETVRTWMIEGGLLLSRAQRRRFHRPRLRREAYGELIQIDGSDHRWFEDRGLPCTLLVFIDDATSRLMQMRFVPSESTFAYFEALELYLQEHGRPVAFYSDRNTIFRVARQDAQSGHGMTQFGRALSELNIEILCANSSQAKAASSAPTARCRTVSSRSSASPASRPLPRRTRSCRASPHRRTPVSPRRQPVRTTCTGLSTCRRIGSATSSAGATNDMSVSSRVLLTSTARSCSTRPPSPGSRRQVRRHLRLSRWPFRGPLEGPAADLQRLRQGSARQSCRGHRKQAPRRRPRPYPGPAERRGTLKEAAAGRQASDQAHEDRTTQSRRLEPKAGAPPSRQRSQGDPRGRSGLRSLTSPPRPAHGSSRAPLLLCAPGDILTW